MTAYLEPGDKIHICFSVPQGSADEMDAATEQVFKELCTMYANMGVVVAGGTGCTNLANPMVVSVVREPKLVGAATAKEHLD